jgi:protein-tyrosine phosphatase
MGHMAGEPREVLSVAFICTGNRFRSPLAAAFLARAAADVPLRIVSLGTLELGPVPALPEAVEVAERRGLDLGSHRARTIRDVDLGPFDLVLGFERAHLSAAIVDGGAREGHTFMLAELVSLLDRAPLSVDGAAPAQRARARIAQAHRLRAFPAAEFELPDPLGRPVRAQRKIAARLELLVQELAAKLFV